MIPRKIEAEKALDGIYVIRTPVKKEAIDTAGTVTAYKNLSRVERDFRSPDRADGSRSETGGNDLPSCEWAA